MQQMLIQTRLIIHAWIIFYTHSNMDDTVLSCVNRTYGLHQIFVKSPKSKEFPRGPPWKNHQKATKFQASTVYTRLPNRTVYIKKDCIHSFC